MNANPLPRISGYVLPGLLAYGILTLWVQARWSWSFYQVCVFALSLIWTVQFIRGRVRLRLHPALIPLATCVLWCAVQLAFGQTVYRWDTWSALWNWTVNLLLCFLLMQISSDPEIRQMLLRFFVYFAFGVALLATVQGFTSKGQIFWMFPSGYTDFIPGPFVNRNQYSAWIELLLPVPLYCAITSRRNAWAFAAIAGCMAASVIAAASRAGTVLVLSEIPVVAWLALRQRVAKPRSLAIVAAQFTALSLIFIAAVGWDGVWRRFESPDLIGFRGELLASSLEMVRDRPIIGFGLGTWSIVYPKYAHMDIGFHANQAHNDWLQWAAEGGIPFFLMMAFFAVLLLRPAIQSLWGVGSVFMLMHCLVDYPMQQRPALAAFFFAFAGMILSVRKLRPVPVTRD